MRFNSKIDWWYWAVIGFVVLLLGYSTFVAVSAAEAVAIWTMVFAWMLGLGLPLWLAFSTYYVVEQDSLLIRSGPFKWVIDTKTITSIEPSRSSLSSPALSLKRLEITYGNHQTILVSPKDWKGFIRALKDST